VVNGSVVSTTHEQVSRGRVDVYERRDAWPRALDTALRDAGFDVRLHDDPTQLVASALRERPAAFVVRVEMPRDGLSLCGKLRKRKGLKNVPVLLMSSDEDTFAERAGFRTAADAYVALPAGPDTIVREVLALFDAAVQPRPRSLVEQAQALIDARRDRRRKLKTGTSWLREQLEAFATAVTQSLPQTSVDVALLQPPAGVADVPRILLSTLRDDDMRRMLGAAKRKARMHPVNMAMQVLSWETTRRQCRRGDVGPVRAIARSVPIATHPPFVLLRGACQHARACRDAFGDRLVAYVIRDLDAQPHEQPLPALVVLEGAELSPEDADRVKHLADASHGLAPVVRSAAAAEVPEPATSRALGEGAALLGHRWTERRRARTRDAALAPLEEVLKRAMERRDWRRAIGVLDELAKKTSTSAQQAEYRYEAAAIHVERLADEPGAIRQLGALLAVDPHHQRGRDLMRALLEEAK
jgi:CheY-like chemotaxis protein